MRRCEGGSPLVATSHCALPLKGVGVQIQERQPVDQRLQLGGVPRSARSCDWYRNRGGDIRCPLRLVRGCMSFLCVELLL
jgi:hypothetical protein